MNARAYGEEFHRHVHSFFDGHRQTQESFERGPIQALLPGFHVIRIAPGPRTGRDVWVYISVGCGLLEVEGARPLEFLIAGDKPRDRFVELLAMACHYHAGNVLEQGHTLPVGEPWIRRATVDHMLVSLPYIFGPELEVFSSGGAHSHILWLLPVTAREVAFKRDNGLEALESRLEEAAIQYWDFKRESVV